MKRIFLFLLLININYLLAQNLYFGNNFAKNHYQNKDRLIMNIPSHTDGRFNDYDSFNKLIKFINKNPNLLIKIEIHFYYGTEEFAMRYSEGLVCSMKKIFSIKCRYNNYEILAKGKTNPIFLNQDTENYREINTRMEVFCSDKVVSK
jgi:hypothetical protein